MRDEGEGREGGKRLDGGREGGREGRRGQRSGRGEREGGRREGGGRGKRERGREGNFLIPSSSMSTGSGRAGLVSGLGSISPGLSLRGSSTTSPSLCWALVLKKR